MPTEMSMVSTGLFDSNILLRNCSLGDFPAGSQGTNASGLAAVAFSTLPAGSTLAVPLARPGAVPMIGSPAALPFHHTYLQ
jgi:hypothetical protein